MIQGAIFVVVVMAFRRGIVGELIAVLQARMPRRDAASPQIGSAPAPVATHAQGVSEA
jgi:hypothetical protein